MSLFKTISLIACLCFNAYATRGLFSQLVKSGQLSESEAANFAARAQTAEVAEQILHNLKNRETLEGDGLKERRRGLLGGILGGLLGGGLLNGVLQPFTGVLAGLEGEKKQNMGRGIQLTI